MQSSIRRRARQLNTHAQGRGPVLYWMSRDQRAWDNWALLYAQSLAQEQNQPFAVCFSLVPGFLGAPYRHYAFMIRGLEKTAQTLEKLRIPFFLFTKPPETEIPGFIKRFGIRALVTDFSPLKIARAWKNRVSYKAGIPVYEVDAHNIVPCWAASDKEEYAARTFRPKVTRLSETYLELFPRLLKQQSRWPFPVPKTDWEHLISSLSVDRSVGEIESIPPGENAAEQKLKSFLQTGIHTYARDRNDPTKNGQSGLSPYIHFGQISAARILLEVKNSKAPVYEKNAFIEELLVRRELSENFCFYNNRYDSASGFRPWAKRTLEEHVRNRREYIYTQEELENAKTHDSAWNACQLQMLHEGKMHGYMRMYWAKKILEWSKDPETALKTAIYLNDTYEIDGRDPNGYTGIAWSIGGVHDRPWGERPVYGSIRSMTYGGLRKKFDVEAYARRYTQENPE